MNSSSVPRHVVGFDGSNVTSSSSPPQYSSAMLHSRRQFNTVVIAVELLSLVPLYAVSVYVVRVMCTTSILHFNLRLLFVFQSAAGMCFGVGRLSMNTMNLISTTPYVGSLVDKFLTRYGAIANIFATPLLVVERIVATLCVDSYEQNTKGYRLLYASMFLLLAVSAYYTVKGITSQLYHHRLFNPWTTGVYVLNILAGVITFVVLLMVLRHNERSYKADLLKRDSHSLSTRYQRSENIRASRQLLPIILIHVLQNIPSCVFIYLSYMGALSNPLDYITYSNLVSLAVCWFYIALQVATIVSHPMLRRDALGNIYDWPCLRMGGGHWGTRRTQPSSIELYGLGNTVVEKTNYPPSTCGLKTMDGRELIPRVGDHLDEHFKTLASFWGDAKH